MSDDHDDRVEEPRVQPVSRRTFLKGSSAALAGGAAVATMGPAHVLAQDATPAATPAMPGMQTTGNAGAQNAPVKFFTESEAKTVDAIVSRIMPGTADDPGAHEAGVVTYIDNQLFGTNLGYDLKTYQQGPFLVMSDQTLPVESSSAEDIYHTVPIVTDQAGRYGYQSSLVPQEVYRRGLGFVDAYAQSKFKKNFVDLAADQQDSILTDMAADKATGFDGPSAKAFFGQLRNDTIEGMFSDPMYGGNQGMVGWKLVGFPGAQHRYTPDDMHNPSFSVAPMSLAQMINGQ